MSRTKRSASALLLAGLLAVVFFWVTDPRYGSRWLYDGGEQDVIDAVHWAWPGTIFGIIGSVVIFAVGVFLVTRKAR